MVSKQYSSLGVKVTVQVPATVEEFDANAKSLGACLAESIDNVAYRSYLSDFRSAFCEAVEASTKIVRKVKTIKKGDKEVEVWDETEGEYIRGVRVTKGWEDDNVELQRIADEANAPLVFDASATPRKPGEPKKLAEAYRVAATRIFTNGNQTKWAEKLGLTYTGDQPKDIELLGWAVKRLEDAKRKAEVDATYV